MEILMACIIFGALAYGYQYNKVIRENKDLKDWIIWLSGQYVDHIKMHRTMIDHFNKTMSRDEVIGLIQWLYEHVGERPLSEEYAEKVLGEFYEQTKK